MICTQQLNDNNDNCDHASHVIRDWPTSVGWR